MQVLQRIPKSTEVVPKDEERMYPKSPHPTARLDVPRPSSRQEPDKLEITRPGGGINCSRSKTIQAKLTFHDFPQRIPRNKGDKRRDA